MTNWKERFKPENATEKTFYSIILVILVLVVVFLINSIFNVSIPSERVTFIGLLIIIPGQVYAFLKERYLLSKRKAILVSIVCGYLGFLGIFIIMGLIISLFSLLPHNIYQRVEIILVITIMMIGAFCFYKSRNFISTLVFDKVLKLQPLDTTDTNS